jgi:hypothetical protein
VGNEIAAIDKPVMIYEVVDDCSEQVVSGTWLAIGVEEDLCGFKCR